jgi:small GTP-binding protein
MNEGTGPPGQPLPVQDTKIKVVFVGDDGVGKTSLATCYRDGISAMDGELPVIIPNFAKEEFVGDKKVTLVLWDSGCSADYDEIRPMGYFGAHFFVICFALNSKESLRHALSVWSREISPHLGLAFTILVGTKRDVQTVSERDIDPIRRLINPRYYALVSSKTGENVSQLFRTIATLIVDPERIPNDPPQPLVVEKRDEMPLTSRRRYTQEESSICLIV